MTAAQYFGQWWIGEIAVPVFFTVVIGGAVNLWVGFFTADLIATRDLLHEAGFYLASFQSISTHEERKRVHFSPIQISSFTFALRSLNQPEAAEMVFRTFKTATEIWKRIQARDSDEGINDLEHPYCQDITELACASLELIETKPNLKRLAFGRIALAGKALWPKAR